MITDDRIGGGGTCTAAPRPPYSNRHDPGAKLPYRTTVVRSEVHTQPVSQAIIAALSPGWRSDRGDPPDPGLAGPGPAPDPGQVTESGAAGPGPGDRGTVILSSSEAALGLACSVDSMITVRAVELEPPGRARRSVPGSGGGFLSSLDSPSRLGPFVAM
eukprot:70050-Hanusia_phi.AAC.1